MDSIAENASKVNRSRLCLICHKPFVLIKSDPRKYCLDCTYQAKIIRNRKYGDRHSKEWLKRYNQSEKRKQYLMQWKQANPTWVRDYWRKKREPKKLAKQFTKNYLTRLASEFVWQQ